MTDPNNRIYSTMETEGESVDDSVSIEDLREFVTNNMEQQRKLKQDAVNGSPAFSGALGREMAYTNVLNWIDNRTDS